MIDLMQAAAEDFEPQLGAMFPVALGQGTGLELELTEVQRLLDLRRNADGTARPGTAAFSLVWQGPLEPLLPQRIYVLQHPELGPFEVFLVPLGPENGRMEYQAVFY